MRGKAIFVAVLLAGVGAPRGVAEDEADVGAKRLEEARSLLAEANAHRDAGRFAEAVAGYERAVALLEGDDAVTEELAQALTDLGSAQKERGRAADAVPAIERALKLRRELHKDDHRDVARTLSELASVLRKLGRPADALEIEQQALAMRRRLFSGDHADVATGMNDAAVNLLMLGRYGEALALEQESLAMRRRLFPGDHRDIAEALGNLGAMFGESGRSDQSLALQEEALAMRRRLFPGDHADVAASLDNLAATLDALGRSADSLPLREEALAMWRRLFPGDHPSVARGLADLAATLALLGRHRETMPIIEEAVAMRRRISPGDGPELAVGLGRRALAHLWLGQHEAALQDVEEALAMWRRLFEGDHRHVTFLLNAKAVTLRHLGRYDDALPAAEEALLMTRRLLAGDHPEVAKAVDTLAHVLGSLGRHAEALPLYEESLAMRRRLFPGDHPDVAEALNNLAATLGELGRNDESIPLYQDALAMARRIFRGDHPAIGMGLNNLAFAYAAVYRPADALPLLEEASAMERRLFPGDNPRVAANLNNLASCLLALDRAAEAVAPSGEALAMHRRLFHGDHPDIAKSLHNRANVCDALGRCAEALPLWQEAADMGRRGGFPDRHFPLVQLGRAALDAGDAESALAPLAEAIEHLETLRSQSHALGAEESARYTAEKRRANPFPLAIEAQVALGRPGEALDTLERGRARAMLDLLKQGRGVPLARAAERARAEGDERALERIEAVQHAVRNAEATVVERGRAAESARGGGVLAEIRSTQAAEAEARRALEKAVRDRLHAVRGVLPETRPLGHAEIQALLGPGERMLVYGLGERASFVLLVRPAGEEIDAVRLGADLDRVTEAVAAYGEALGKPGGTEAKAGAGRRLFDLVMPAKVWAEARAAKRVYVLPHGPLHRIPFETLVTGEKDGNPVYWADEGPPVAYAASGSVLAWLRRRRAAAAAEGPALVAVGDPRFVESGVAWPEKGVLVRDVVPDGQAAALGVRPGDVLVAYAGREVTDLVSLREATGAASGKETVEARFVREGEERAVSARPGKLGVLLAEQPPRVSGPELLAKRPVASAVRGSATRYGRLPPLPGTRKEVEGIRGAFPEGARVVTLLGAEATEEKLFDAADGARYLHIATHGLIDDTESASFSALALTRPRLPVPGDDGYLTLADLLERWRGRLDGTSLVVLSACESQKGRLERDEGMLALPWGFCFAGAPAVVASLWKVDDESTALLMSDLYRRLISEGALGPCEALHEARRALMKTQGDPYRWGAFVFVGAP
jgi:tetratricopeptide (TPR) repeat protein